MDFKKVVNEVVEHSGGESNIRSVVHCATRLRLELNDEEKYDKYYFYLDCLLQQNLKLNEIYWKLTKYQLAKLIVIQ